MAAKNFRQMLEAKAAENTQRHHEASHSDEFNIGRQHLMVPVDEIEPNPFQPRLVFDEAKLRELATTISADGLGEPVLLRRKGDAYELIAGERRWRAVKLLNHPTIEAIVVDADDAKTATLALVENLQREDLTDFEVSLAIKRVLDQFPQRSKLAEYLGITRSDLYRYLAFQSLPESVQERLRANPKLLGRVAADDIAKVLREGEGAPDLIQRLEQAIALVEQGRLDQTKVAATIVRSNGGNTSRAEKTHLTSNGAKVGSFVRDHKNIVVKIATGALSEEKAAELQKFVVELFE
ncbi:ParB/RepB/Spo0J family partition protein [Burkholderia vietnamiensis]|uniref:ParB/RepB/Spo0J family partition protein n=1 Tax=Burkholderia vietnamiensis TaxID=60552 RepID=UPI001B983E5B|nr:ParB/RepB/Spo0J family partition protein [Burkholderia vietnamiensis]MBR7919752.1 ParB/RepB/Spo0J family partition protein [Burkholderia vietnamiensis]MBR8205254.1 ParB/RepB/Spo0J family partition protein [Burkholderia vietnamiensis]HDR9135075.1 ParB/RepB/Spo0J family partition protein [Burkholderia vietnamiensis]